MPKVTDAARVTTREGSIWRECPGCGRLVAMAPEALLCDGCASSAPVRSAGGWSR
jgi:hypothetical protein